MSRRSGHRFADKDMRQAMSMRGRWGPIVLWGGLLVYPLVVAQTDSAAFLQDVGATLVLAAISACAWNIVGGYAGQVSVGHAIFFGAGAYMPLLAYELWQAPPLLRLPFGIPVAAPIPPVLRTPTLPL